MATVVNVKVNCIRPKYANLAEWMVDPNNVYIGRAGIVFINGERFPKTSSIFCNPFKIKPGVTREDVLRDYREYIEKKFTDVNFCNELAKLRGKNLGCWCHPEPCHGDILVELLNRTT
jgi:hypothetical protein